MAATGNDELPNISMVYWMYDNAEPQDFENSAKRLLGGKTWQFHDLHGINLRILVANVTADAADATEYYITAQEGYWKARNSRQGPEEVRVTEELGRKLARVEAAIKAAPDQCSRGQEEQQRRGQAFRDCRRYRDSIIDPWLYSAGELLGQGQVRRSSPEAEAGSRKRKIAESVKKESSEKHKKTLSGQEDTLKNKLRAFLEGEREKHQTEIKNHQTEIEKHEAEIKEHQAEVKTQFARIKEIDKELERL